MFGAGKANGRLGFTRKELIVIIAGVALLSVFVFLPALAKAQEKARRAGCTCRLMQIGLAFRTWSGDHNDQYPMSALTNQDGTRVLAAGTNVFRCFQVMSNELNNPGVLVCPADQRRPTDFGKMNNANLSYFAGLDADETMPAMLLSGDRNLVTNGVPVSPGLLVLTPASSTGFSAAMHKFVGNIGLSDGSVQQTTSAGLSQYLQRSGTNVTRLAMP